MTKRRVIVRVARCGPAFGRPEEEGQRQEEGQPDALPPQRARRERKAKAPPARERRRKRERRKEGGGGEKACHLSDGLREMWHDGVVTGRE